MMLIVTHNLTVNKNIIARGNVYVTDSIRAKNMEGIDANFRNLTSTNNVEIQNNLTVGADASINGDFEVKGYIKSPDIDKMNNKNRADSLYFQDLIGAGQLQRQEADTGIRYSVSGLRAKVSADSAFFESSLDADSLYFQDLIDMEISGRVTADNTLQTNLGNEETARISADNTLQINIAAEESARLTADAALQDKLNADSTYLKDLIDAGQLQRQEADSGIRYSVSGLRAKVSADSAYFESALVT